MILAERGDVTERPFGQAVDREQVRVDRERELVDAATLGVQLAAELIDAGDPHPPLIPGTSGAFDDLARGRSEFRPFTVAHQVAVDAVATRTEVHGDRVERVVRRRGGVAVPTVLRDRGRKPRTELRARTPRAVAETVGVDRDGLAAQHDGAGVTTGLVEVMRTEVVRWGDRRELEIDVELIAIGVVELHAVPVLRLDALVVDAVRETNIGQRLVRYR